MDSFPTFKEFMEDAWDIVGATVLLGPFMLMGLIAFGCMYLVGSLKKKIKQ